METGWDLRVHRRVRTRKGCGEGSWWRIRVNLLFHESSDSDSKGDSIFA